WSKAWICIAPDRAANSWLAASASAYRSPTTSSVAPYSRIRSTLAGSEMRGTKIRARTDNFRAARATAAPWLPPEAATTPAAGTSRSRRFANAPRALKEPDCWSSSSLRAARAEILALHLHDGGAPDVRPDGLLGRCDRTGIDHHWRSLKVPDGSSRESALRMLARAASHWSHPLPREQRKTRGSKTRCSTVTFTRSGASLRRASALPTFPSRWSPRARSHSSASWKPAQQ